MTAKSSRTISCTAVASLLKLAGKLHEKATLYSFGMCASSEAMLDLSMQYVRDALTIKQDDDPRAYCFGLCVVLPNAPRDFLLCTCAC